MSPTLGVLALLEAKPGMGDDLGKFLEGGRDLAAAEPGTVRALDGRCASSWLSTADGAWPGVPSC
jgi:hypothetical protein